MDASLFFSSLTSLSWGGAVIAMVLSTVLGMLWFGPFFGKPWMKYTGVKPSKDDNMGLMFGLELLNTILRVSAIFVLLTVMGASNLAAALTLALFLLIGSGWTTDFSSAVWEGRGWGLFLINAGRLTVEMIMIVLCFLYIPF